MNLIQKTVNPSWISLSINDRSATYNHATNTVTGAVSDPSTAWEDESAMQVDDEGPTNLSPQNHPQCSNSDSSDSGSDNLNDSSDDSSDSSDARPFKYVKSGEGTSKSVASRSIRQSVKSGTFIINQERYRNWKTKILQSDRDREFDEHDLWKIRHSESVCGKWKKVKEPYNTTQWKTWKHLKDCEDMKEKIFKIPSLFSMGFVKVAKKAQTMVIEPQNVPCLGIRVTKYLKRTAALGGGGRSLAVISKERFKKKFSKLKLAKSKKTVVSIQIAFNEWKWRRTYVFFQPRVKRMCPDRSSNAKRPRPCPHCIAVLRSRPFKNAIRIPIPHSIRWKLQVRELLLPQQALGQYFWTHDWSEAHHHRIEDDVWSILFSWLAFFCLTLESYVQPFCALCWRCPRW